MKTVAMILTALALTAPLTAFAAGDKTATGKNTCLLYSENCPEQADTIFEKIAKLQNEIARGNVYSPIEIARLENKLEEYQGYLDTLISGAGGD